MAITLRQSTASQEVPIGAFVDTTPAVTTPTVANTDIKIWKNGATTLASKNSGGATNISNGVQYAVLDATDTDTLGPLVIFVFVSGSLPIRVECDVISAAAYDLKYGASATHLAAFGVLGFGTLDAGTTSSVTLPSGQRNGYADQIAILILSGVAIGQYRKLSTYDSSTGVGAPSVNFANAPSTALFISYAVPKEAPLGSTDFAVDVFDSLNPVPANVEEVNTVPIVGDGSGTPFNV